MPAKKVEVELIKKMAVSPMKRMTAYEATHVHADLDEPDQPHLVHRRSVPNADIITMRSRGNQAQGWVGVSGFRVWCRWLGVAVAVWVGALSAWWQGLGVAVGVGVAVVVWAGAWGLRLRFGLGLGGLGGRALGLQSGLGVGGRGLALGPCG